MGLAVLQVLVVVVLVCIYKGVWAVKELQACGSTYFLSEFVALQRFARQRSLCNCTGADPYQICSTEVSADLYARRSTPSHTFAVLRKYADIVGQLVIACPLIHDLCLAPFCSLLSEVFGATLCLQDK